MAQVVTANRLTDGVVVFVGPEGQWVERLDEAVLWSEAASIAGALERAKADERANIVVEPYAIEVRETSRGVQPAHLREVIRAAGPTVHPDHGKQASQAGAEDVSL